MTRTPMTRAAALAAAAVAAPLFAPGTARAAVLTTVGVYDENVTATNTVDRNSASPNQNLTVSAFTSLVASAFANNTGGVVNFDSLALNESLVGTNRQATFTYGADQSRSLLVTVPTSFTGPIFGDSASTPISGNRQLSTSSGFKFSLNFDKPLSAFGITVLDREATTGSRGLPLTFTLQSGAIVTLSDNVGANGPAGVANDDTFFGYQAPAGNPIVSAFFNAGNFQRYDDLGFITTETATIAVPEPASLGLAAAGGLMLLGRRRRA